MDAPCNLQESIHVLVTKYLFVSSFWGTHQSPSGLFCLDLKIAMVFADRYNNRSSDRRGHAPQGSL